MNLTEAFKGFFKKKVEVETTENPVAVDRADDDNTPASFNSYNRGRSIAHNKRKKKDIVNKFTRANQLNQIILTCRRISSVPEVDEVVMDIVNSILDKGQKRRYNLNFGEETTNKLDSISQTEITNSFNKILGLLNFEDESYNIIHNSFIDGRFVAECVYEEGGENKGIHSINMLSPLNLIEGEDSDGEIIKYYMGQNIPFIDHRFDKDHETTIFKDEQIVISPIFYIDPHTGLQVSPIYKATKATNNLTNIEDSMVLVRFMKGMMLRIWNVNVGRLPKTKAESFLKEVSNSINSDIKYNTQTGEIENKTNMMKIFQDFVFPARSNNDITNVETVDGDNNLLEGPDHELFLKKLYKSLNQPVSRLSETPTIEFDSMDLLKDEETFNKYIVRLRAWVKTFLFELVRRDLVAQGKLENEDWNLIKQNVSIDWQESSNLINRVRMELWSKRSETLEDLKDSGILGNFISYDYALKNILGLSTQEIEDQKKLIEAEKKESPWLYQEEED